MKLSLIASMLLTGCISHAEASESSCGPAPKAYLEQSNASCRISDGGVFTLADGRAAPNLYVCVIDGSVVESWCQ